VSESPDGAISLSEALHSALSSETPDHEQVRGLLVAALEQDLTTPMRVLLLRTLAVTYVILGDHEAAYDGAHEAYGDACTVTLLDEVDVDLVIDATHTCINVLTASGKQDEVASLVQAALETALPHASPPQKARMMEVRMRAAAMQLPVPPND